MLEQELKKAAFLKILVVHSVQDEDFSSQMRALVEEHASKDLISRLKLLKKNKLIPANVDILTIDRAVIHQIFSAMFFSGLSCVIEPKVARQVMLFAIANFARGIQS